MNLKEPKREFSLLGWGLTVFSAVSMGAQLLAMGLLFLLEGVFPAAAQSEFLNWVVTFLPIYGLGIPCCLLVLKKIPAWKKQPMAMGIRQFLGLLLMCFPVMYIGNIIGTVLSMLFSGGQAENALVDLVTGNYLYTFLFAVVIAPIMEEFVFRKCLLDRCGKFGEVGSILFSAFTFALFHMNLFQFFYAFGLGILFAYAYTRTGKLRYPVLLHMVVNFMGSVAAPFVLELISTDAFLSFMEGGNLDNLLTILPQLVIFGLYCALVMLLNIAGVVMLALRWKNREIYGTAMELPKGTALRTMYCNPGMAAFLVLCSVMIVLALFL